MASLPSVAEVAPMPDAIHEMLRADTEALRAALTPCMGKLAVALLGRPTGRSRNDLRFRRHQSLSVVIAGPKAGSWYDYEAAKGGDVFGLIARVRECAFPEAKQFALDFLGGTIPLDLPPVPEAVVGPPDEVRIAEAMARWDEATDPRGTVVEAYLASRKLPLPDCVAGDTIRFHPVLRLDGHRVPGMIALMRDLFTDEPRAVHRTFLTPDGVKLGKKMLGPVKGAAVKITPDADVTVSLTIGEGVETCLAADKLGFGPVWALGSVGAIGSCPVLPVIETLRILIETDDKGANKRAAKTCAERWCAAGREVRSVIPQLVGDMADVVLQVA